MVAGGMLSGMSVSRCMVTTLCILLAWLRGHHVAVAAPPPCADCVSIADAKSLVEQDDLQSRATRIRGTVTWCWQPLVDRTRPLFILQDDTGGIWVNVVEATQQGIWGDGDPSGGYPTVSVGDEVEIAGRIARGGFAPNILPASVEVVGRRPLPEPFDDNDRVFSGFSANRRGAVEGVVQAARWNGQTGWVLSCSHDGRPFLADVPKEILPDGVDGLIDSEVLITGAASSTFNTRGQFIMPKLFVARRDDFRVVVPARIDPFDAPTVPLTDIAQERPRLPADHRIKTSGTVTKVDPNGLLYVQDALVGVRVEAAETPSCQAGDQVEVVGFVDRSRDFAGLTGAIVRAMGVGTMPPPQPVSPRTIISTIESASTYGRMASPTDYDGCLVTFTGKLIDIQRSPAGRMLSMTADDTSFDVRLEPHLAFDAVKSEAGAEFTVTGILTVALRQPFERFAVRASEPKASPVERLTLLPRSAADIVVIKPAPWWNARRLAVAAGALASVLLAAVAWAALLRRRVAIETARATQEIRRRHDAEIEFEASIRERNRLAANLHDTLLQTLGGAGFQLDTCRRAVARSDLADTSTHLDVARRMLKHAAGELRGSVWALRTTPLAGKSFAESLSGIIGHLRQGQAARIDLDVTGEPVELPDFVAGNLLLVAQEAIRNALHHAQPSAVRVAVAYDEATHSLTLTVSDDGRGFDTAAAAGPAQGHFGIQGMRERIGSLGGLVAIESQPGRGTTVRVQLSRIDEEFCHDTGRIASGG
jgi:signal transduction histidine kinase